MSVISDLHFWPREEFPMTATLVRQVEVSNAEGLHLRLCLAVVQAVRRYRVSMHIRKGDQAEDASSMLGLLSLGAGPGHQLQLSASGPEAEIALDAVSELLASGPSAV